MELALTVLGIVAPVFSLALIGFVWIKAGFEYRTEFVTRLAMSVSVPCLIFVALMTTEVSLSEIGGTFQATLATYAIIIAACWALVQLLRLRSETYLAPMIFNNTGNIGLPLALFAFGKTGLDHAVIIFAIMAVLSFSLGIWMITGGGQLTRALREPMLWATMAGALFLVMGWRTPQWLTNTIDLIGQMAIPLMLLTLGVALARLEVKRLLPAFGLSALKFTICAGAAWLVGTWMDLSYEAFGVLVLQAATPVAVTSYMLAQKYGRDAEHVAGLVVASTLLAVVGLPLLLGLVL